MAGYPTLDFPIYPYQTYSQMLFLGINKFLLSNAGSTPAPEKEKHTLCAVFKPGNNQNNYILSGVSGYGYTPGFSLMGIQIMLIIELSIMTRPPIVATHLLPISSHGIMKLIGQYLYGTTT